MYPTPTNKFPINNQGQLDTSIQGINNYQNPPKLNIDPELNSFLPEDVNDPLRMEIQNSISTMRDSLNQPQNNQSISDYYNNALNQFGISEDKAKLLDLERIYKGSEDDIKKEIGLAGGIANDSQVQSLIGVRNKPIILQYEALSKSLSAKNELVDKLVNNYKLDRDQANALIDKKLNLSNNLIDQMIKLKTLDDSAIKSLQTYSLQKSEQAKDRLKLLMETGGLSNAPSSALYQLAQDSGVDVNLIMSAAKSKDGQLKLKNAIDSYTAGYDLNQLGGGYGPEKTIEDVLGAISGIESSGDYGAISAPSKNGDKAYGKYQIMGKNIPSWSKEVLGKSISVQDFINNPALQDKIATYKLQQAKDNYGTWEDAASVWFTGKPLSQSGNPSDVYGTTNSMYQDKFKKLLYGQSEQKPFVDPVVANYVDAINNGAQIDDIIKGTSREVQRLRGQVMTELNKQGGITGKSAELLTDAKSVVDDLLNTKGYKALGGYSTVLGGQFTTSYGDAKANASRLEALMARDNLGILKGAMSDKDLVFIKAMSTGFDGEGTQSEEYVEQNLLEIQEKLQNKLNRSGFNNQGNTLSNPLVEKINGKDFNLLFKNE